jgi:hypothetical protein
MIFILFFFIDTKYNTFLEKKKENANKGKQKNEENDMHNLRKWVHFLASIITLLLSIYIMFKIKQLYFFLLFPFMLIIVVTVPYLLWVFIHYIFIDPNDFIFTEKKELAFKTLAIMLAFAYEFISSAKVGEAINKYLLHANYIFADILMIFLLVSWYFIFLFFTLSLLMLSLQRGLILLNNNTKVNTAIKAFVYKERKQKEDKEFVLWANLIIKEINNIPRHKKMKRISYNIVWYLSIIIDVARIAINGLVLVMWHSIKLATTVLPVKIIKHCISGFSKIASNNLGRTIIIISRISLIISLLIVFLIDKYIQVFSTQGSSIYEFLCSVITIPLIITRIIDIKGQKEVT